MATSSRLLLSAFFKPASAASLPETAAPADSGDLVPDREPDPFAGVSGPDSMTGASASGGGVEAPLTSEPPLPALAPLTSEPPLAAEPPLTSEPTAAGLGGAAMEPIEF
ncbi:hypothetical protein LRS74_22795 [Streptomyces sp. LX-29]|uniref:hypothetical protein n=1 Tax=Streptomyces sp. LX-29 TaxID=2900152 RepID=UPI00240D15EB|nr:hypothetical protein [Streptomyces sp. LX-29]WFB09558.1 hypothetical protein LRS74_22795 [Streptomyces sp. LX-29]